MRGERDVGWVVDPGKIIFSETKKNFQKILVWIRDDWLKKRYVGRLMDPKKLKNNNL